jgi:hypothetical protein
MEPAAKKKSSWAMGVIALAIAWVSTCLVSSAAIASSVSVVGPKTRAEVFGRFSSKSVEPLAARPGNATRYYDSLGEVAIECTVAPVRGMDFVESTGRLGGELYDAGKLAKLERYLDRRGIKLKVGDEFVPDGKAGGFAQDGSSLVFRSNPTNFEVWHELGHLRQFQKIGKDAYMKLPRSTTFNAPEQHVFDLLENSKKRWNALNFDEQQHAIDYIERIGGFR